MNEFKRKYIGNKAFYKMVLLLVVPMIIQQGITNLVNLLDNVMVGAMGTQPMSGVAISNQLIFIFNLTIFGGLSGASIFGAQFFGVSDYKGMRNTMRFKMVFGMLTVVAAMIIFTLFGEELVKLFLDNKANTGTDISVTLGYAKEYLGVIIWGLLPFMIVQVYSGTLRETGETVVPMIASLCAVVFNLIFNYLLIYGHLGFPELGVEGAAIATVGARYIEMLIVVVYVHRNSHKFPFIVGIFRKFKIPWNLVKKIIITGWPLLVNEVMWSLGYTFITQNYSTRGLAVVASVNITMTTWQLFSIVMFAMGHAVSILVGQKLGANKIEEAKELDNKLMFFSVVANIGVGILVILSSFLIPSLYNTEQDVRQLASSLMIISGCTIPIQAYIHVAYFTMRSGGKTVVTFLFDCVYTWAVPVVLSFILCRYTELPVVLVFSLVQFSDLIKVAIAFPLLRSGFWAKNVISDKK